MVCGFSALRAEKPHIEDRKVPCCRRQKAWRCAAKERNCVSPTINGSGKMKADALMLRGQAIVSEASAIDAERNQADALLVTRIRAGDEQAFELLMARYQAPLFRYLRGLVHDQEQARDLLQETFLR